jgi:AcrR family transcriptional regulator
MSDPAGDAGWRGRAVERSLRNARERAVSRSERFIQVATELLHETGNLDFTVQELVERSRMSLRSFYQHFASKDELILAVFEEAIRGYIAGLRETVSALDDPVERLRAYITSFSDAGSGGNQRASQALSRYLLVLTRDEPAELARVLEPQVSLLDEILRAGVTSGQVRTDIPTAGLTMLLTHTLMAAVEMNVLGVKVSDFLVRTEDLWAFCAGAVLTAETAEAELKRPVA